MTDLASGAEARIPVPATNRVSPRVGVILALAVAAVALLGYFTTATRQSSAATQIRSDAQATFSPHSVSCRQVDGIPALTASKIYACKITGVERANRPISHTLDATFTRCYIRTVGDQTVDVSRAVSVISQDHHKTAPCS